MNKFNGVCIMRGGSWNYHPSLDFRAHFRPWDYPDFRYYGLGFRCIAPIDSPTVQRLVRIK